MQLAKEIFSKALAEEILRHISTDSFDLKSIIEMPCYIALREIKAILEDESFTDEECIIKIDEIIHIFEELGYNGGPRHDYG